MKFSELLETARVLQEALNPTKPLDEKDSEKKIIKWTVDASRLLTEDEIEAAEIVNDDDTTDLSNKVVDCIVELRGEYGDALVSGDETLAPEKEKKKVSKKKAAKKETKTKKAAKKTTKKTTKKAAKKTEKKAKPKKEAKKETETEATEKKAASNGFKEPRKGTAAHEIYRLMSRKSGVTKDEIFKMLSKKFPDRNHDEGTAHHALRSFAARLRQNGVKYTCESGTYRM